MVVADVWFLGVLTSSDPWLWTDSSRATHPIAQISVAQLGGTHQRLQTPCREAMPWVNAVGG